MPLEDFRPMYCQLGCSSKADGSAQLTQGQTTVITGTFGPVEIQRNREKSDRLDVEVKLLPRVGQSGVDSRFIECIIKETVESSVRLAVHPRAGLNLSLHILEQDEGVISTSINASCLALADSGISMNFLFTAITVAVLKETPESEWKIVIDPCAKTIRKANESSILVFVFESRNQDIIATHIQAGKCGEAKFQESLGLARKASSSMFEFYRDIIKKKFSKEFESTNEN